MSRGRAQARYWGRQFEETNDYKFLVLAVKAGVAAFGANSYPVKIARIGRGEEGVVCLRIRPVCGKSTATAFKTIKYGSPWYSEHMLARQTELGMALQDSKAVAAFVDSGQLSTGDLFIEREFIPGPLLSRGKIHCVPGLSCKYLCTRLQLARRARRYAGYTVMDAKPGNMILDDRTGLPVCIDFLPFRQDEIYANRIRKKFHIQETAPILSPLGEALFPNMEKSPACLHHYSRPDACTRVTRLKRRDAP